MKKVLAVLVALVAIVTSGAARAETVEEWSDGSLRLVSAETPVVTKQVEITFGPGVRDYGDKWTEAYKEPGITVPVKTHSEYKERVGLLHVVLEEITDTGIIREVNDIHLVHDAGRVPDTVLKLVFNPFFLIWLMSVAAIEVFLALLFFYGETPANEVPGWVFPTAIVSTILAGFGPIVGGCCIVHYGTSLLSWYTAAGVVGCGATASFIVRTVKTGHADEEKYDWIYPYGYLGCMIASLLCFLAS